MTAPRGPQNLPPAVGTRPLHLWWLALLALLTVAGLSRQTVPALSRLDMRRWGHRRYSSVGASRKPALALALGTMLLLTLMWSACGNSGGAVTHNPGTPAGTYSLTVTATFTSPSGTLTHTVPLTLTVN